MKQRITMKYEYVIVMIMSMVAIIYLLIFGMQSKVCLKKFSSYSLPNDDNLLSNKKIKLDIKELDMITPKFCPNTSVIHNLMPIPWKILDKFQTRMLITSKFQIILTEYSTNARLRTAVRRFISRLYRKTGILLNMNSTVTSEKLIIECNGLGSDYPQLGENESYQLRVSTNNINLKAKTFTGIVRGLSTLLQLIVLIDTNTMIIPVVEINDKPRFPWRGLLLDVARHFMPVKVIESILNAMEIVKLNVFHWHLTDDQGFRVESKKYPLLHKMGSDGHFYTQEDIKYIVDYARNRSIRVVPEFDMPSHTTSWFVGYPELATVPCSYMIERQWGVLNASMNPTLESTYHFLDVFFDEMATLFPDQYFHTGGDEVESFQWSQSESIQDFIRQHRLNDNQGLQAYFTRRVQNILHKHNKLLIGWDEILSSNLRRGTIIQSWRGPGSLINIVAQGYYGILSHGYYLDHLSSAAFHYSIDPLIGTQWLQEEQSARILGGEACMWSEYVSSATVNSRIWPRTAVIAEKLWSPAKEVDVNCMYDRLKSMNRLIDQIGVKHLSDYTRKLKILVGSSNDELFQSLKILADTCEALGIRARSQTRKYSSLVALNRFVDVLQPESELIRNVETIVRLTKNTLASTKLHSLFSVWATNHVRLKNFFYNNSLFSEIELLSENLSIVGKMGLQVLMYIDNGETVSKKWIRDQNEILYRLEYEVSEIRLAAVGPLRYLLLCEVRWCLDYKIFLSVLLVIILFLVIVKKIGKRRLSLRKYNIKILRKLYYSSSQYC
ncbi:unnamed protein product [Didymodactylos carnosus]|nr:unnamed protein product [Didymodactylos carnosus]CAF4393237.1 unnamed protein product [Didymodactylos carnosus]